MHKAWFQFPVPQNSNNNNNDSNKNLQNIVELKKKLKNWKNVHLHKSDLILILFKWQYSPNWSSHTMQSLSKPQMDSLQKLTMEIIWKSKEIQGTQNCHNSLEKDE